MFSRLGKITGIMVLTALLILPIFLNQTFACDAPGCPHNAANDQQGAMQGDQAMHAMDHSEMAHGMVDAQGRAKGPTMGTIFTTEHLYTCPMHQEVITDNADAKCPICNMALVELSQEEVENLRASRPEGCVMDPIVVDGEGDVHNCSICNMNLSEIQTPDSSTDGHMHDHGM